MQKAIRQIVGLRGMPHDVSPDVARVKEVNAIDHFSASGITLQELQAYPWPWIHRKRGYVSPDEAVLFSSKQVGFSKKSVVLSRLHPNAVRVSWKETHCQSCNHFCEQVIPFLETPGPPDDVRIVFWFSV